MQIKDMVITAFDKIADSGKIEEVIEKTLLKTVESTIDGLFRSYSDFGKSLTAQLSEKIGIDLKEIDIPSYNKMIENMIKEKTTAIMNSQAKKMLDGEIEKILAPIEKDWKLSELVEVIKEDNSNNAAEENWDKISLHIEGPSSGDMEFYHISLDEDPGTEKYRCKIRLFISKGKISNITCDSTDYGKEKFINPYGNIEPLLFRMFSQQVNFIVDEDDVDVYYPDSY